MKQKPKHKKIVRSSATPRKKVAVFDIDGTIFRSSLLIELVDALIMEGIFPRKTGDVYAKEYAKWIDRKGSYEDYIGGVVRAYRNYIKGVPLSDVLRISNAMMRFHKNRVYRFTRDLLLKLKKTHYCVAISHSPYTVVSSFAAKIGFDKVYAYFYEIDSKERFTGNVIEEDFMRDKKRVLLRAIGTEGLTLKGSIGVGDTDSDIPFLKMVEHPIAFNPNEKLYRIAKHLGWDITVERKDVIYKV